MPFVKLDCGILESSLWGDRAAREIFITALLMARPHELTQPKPQLDVDELKPTGWVVPPGKYGLVEAAGSGICRRALVEEQEGRLALRHLCNPESDSRSPDFEGRRLARIDGGYLVLNFQKYRDKDNTIADRQKRWRQRHPDKSNAVTPLRNAVTTVTVTHAEAEAEAEAEYRVHPVGNPVGTSPSPGSYSKPSLPVTDRNTPLQAVTSDKQLGERNKPSLQACILQAVKAGMPESEGEDFFNFFESNGWKVGRAGNPMRSMPGAMGTWAKKYRERQFTSHPSHQPSVSDLRAAIQVKQDKASALRNRFCSDVAMGEQWSDSKAKADFHALRREIRGLQNQIEDKVCTQAPS